VFVHLWALHSHGSNNPLGIDRKGPQDSIPFHPYYTVKDLFGLGVFLIFYAAFVFYVPNLLGEPDNYVPANPLVTPPHIVPEWYFLPYYAILRSTPDILFIPAKLAGVILMFGSIAMLALMPWLDTSPVRSARFRPIYKQIYWLIVLDSIVLTWVGSQPPEGTALVIGRVATAYYFIHFLIIVPLLGKLERPLPLPTSIGTPVLQGGGAARASSARMEKP
jgi:quinol-cytochrome oxidoreductase complex cytochrome b subunit